MVTIEDRGNPIKGEYVKVGLEKIAFDLSKPQLELRLIDWEKKGLRICIELQDENHNHIVQGTYNSEPYATKEEGLRDLSYLKDEVENGNYRIKYTSASRIELSVGETS
tara:strand:+ start:410 stop:736 length:327 start_codon:yes stop_codon:yes gene_type:complete